MTEGTDPPNRRGSPEAVEKRRAARRLNQLLLGGDPKKVATDGRTARRRARLLRELAEGTKSPSEGLKPIEILQRANDLLDLGVTLTALRAAIRVHARGGVDVAQARAMLAEIDAAYGFHPEVYEFLGLPEAALGPLVVARRRGRPPSRRGPPRSD